MFVFDEGLEKGPCCVVPTNPIPMDRVERGEPVCHRPGERLLALVLLSACGAVSGRGAEACRSRTNQAILACLQGFSQREATATAGRLLLQQDETGEAATMQTAPLQLAQKVFNRFVSLPQSLWASLLKARF